MVVLHLGALLALLEKTKSEPVRQRTRHRRQGQQQRTSSRKRRHYFVVFTALPRVRALSVLCMQPRHGWEGAPYGDSYHILSRPCMVLVCVSRNQKKKKTTQHTSSGLIAIVPGGNMALRLDALSQPPTRQQTTLPNSNSSPQQPPTAVSKKQSAGEYITHTAVSRECVFKVKALVALLVKIVVCLCTHTYRYMIRRYSVCVCKHVWV